MKGKRWVLLGIIVAALAALAGAIARAGPPGQGTEPQGGVGAQDGLGTGFTYQGRLESGGEAVSNDCQMAFRLYDAESEGVEVGSAITLTVPVNEGLFTVGLDFGAGAFAGDARWLGVRVLCPGDVAYADLGRQALTAAPYALYALGAPWDGLSGVPAGFADDVDDVGLTSVTWTDVVSRPAGLDDGDDDTTYTAGSGLALSGTTFTVVTDTVQARVGEACAGGSTIQAINADGSVVCWDDADTTYTAGAGLTLSGTTFTVVTDTVQARVVGECTIGSTVRAVNADGSVVCQVDADTTYTAGAGLTLSGTTFAVVTDTVQARVSEACAEGSTIQAINADGSVVCQASAGTTYTAGAGLVLSGTTFTVVTDTVQARVVGACAVGSTVRAINADGSVVCQVDAPLNRSLAPADNVSTTLDAGGDVGRYGSVTIGVDGLPLISYWGDGDLKVAHCADLACTAATSTTVDATGWISEYTSLAIGVDGLPLISYYDDANGDLKVAHCADLACTTESVTTVDTGGTGGDVGRYSSVTIGGDGLPLIGYYDSGNQSLKVAHCDDVACTTAISTTVDTGGTGGDVGRHTSLAMGADGLPLISYWDGTNTNLKVAHCDDLACTSAISTTVDAAGDVGEYTSLAIGADGLPLISYYDDGNQSLKVAHCNDVACTAAATRTTVDDADDVGHFASVTIGADGLPLISYYDNGNQSLKVAHCADVACKVASIITVDAGGDVGHYTSVTIGTDGLPLISYYDDVNDDLKVMHCANPFCVPYWRRR